MTRSITLAVLAVCLIAGAVFISAREPAVTVEATQPRATAAVPQPGQTANVVEVIDGDTVLLDDGHQVRLVGIQAPKLPLGRRNFPTWPLADEAKAALDSLTLGKPLSLTYGGRRMDRHGRLLAHLHDADGRWIQGELLRLGLARMYTFDDNRAFIPEMLDMERKARAAGQGIWRLNYYRIRRVGETPDDIGSFQLVEGRVRNAAVIKGRGYLNFGKDWRTDFTVAIPPDGLRLFAAADIDIAAYAERQVRVRGWLRSFNGPMIEATHPEQIELIGR